MSVDSMQVSELLADLAVKDIKVWVEGDRLRCNAPTGALTAEFRDQLRDRKGEIIAFVNMATAAARQQPAIIPLQPRGTRTPIYAVPGHASSVSPDSIRLKRWRAAIAAMREESSPPEISTP